MTKEKKIMEIVNGGREGCDVYPPSFVGMYIGEFKASTKNNNGKGLLCVLLCSKVFLPDGY